MVLRQVFRLLVRRVPLEIVTTSLLHLHIEHSGGGLWVGWWGGLWVGMVGWAVGGDGGVGCGWDGGVG